MSFNSYLVRKFDYTHENTFFRKFSESLDKKYKDDAGEHVLIGNISCNGHQMDAIFITRGQISVIDFKDYEGKLTFSENNPWRMINQEEKLIFVQGGSQMRNPFQQVRAYRFSLMNYLRNHEPKIFEGNRTNIKWDHIGCIVLFQRKVTYQLNEIPNNARMYFHIADGLSIINTLQDIYSNSLEFTDNEISSIVKALDVNSDNLFDPGEIEKEIIKEKSVSSDKLALIKKLISGFLNDSLYKRLINYYKTLIIAESYKESKTENFYSYTFRYDDNSENIFFNIETNNNFHAIFLEDRKLRFPKNLFVGLNILIEGRSYPILHSIILATELKDENEIKINLNEFELNKDVLESMNLTEDIIDELSASLTAANTLKEKLSVFKSNLNVSGEVTDKLSVGLSSKSLYSAQLISELNSLMNLNEDDIKNDVFTGFIKNSVIPDSLNELIINPQIQISELNSSQQKAIELSFKQPLTVITGPPGTGKSQVVLNIIANAVSNGHSVLFASKNNRAIDCVKDRIEAMIKEPYLLRMGSKNEINNNLKPKLENFIRRNNNDEFSDRTHELDNSRLNLIEKNIRLNHLKSELHKILVLENQIKDKRKLLEDTFNELCVWLDNLGKDFTRVFYDNKNKIHLDINELNLLINKINNYWKSNLFMKIYFNIFLKSRLIKEVKRINLAQTTEVYDYIQIKSSWADPGENLLISAKRNLESLIQLKTNVIELQKRESNIQDIEKSIKDLESEFKELSSKLDQIEEEINEISMILPELGLELFNEITLMKLFNLDQANTQNYIDYLPIGNNTTEELQICSEKFISDFKAICLTSLSIKNSTPLLENTYDLLIIDEASQCDIASALPMIFRSKKVVIIGDPLQLKHITSIQEFEEKYLKEKLNIENNQLNYIKKSLYDFSFALANKSSLESVFLDEHYRCHPQIINFSNSYFYLPKLGQNMEIKTNVDALKYGNTGINWLHVEGEMQTNRNINMQEANKCVDLAKSLTRDFPDASIGIITPFKNQYQFINSLLPEDLKENIKPDTVHRYQGDEKDIIIFSTVVTENSPVSKAKFINSNDYLLNVAITRARSSLYIVGNINYCNKLRNGNLRTPLSNLANYVNTLNRVSNN
jgi:superfamily I DNA and/or RNA helicase